MGTNCSDDVMFINVAVALLIRIRYTNAVENLISFFAVLKNQLMMILITVVRPMQLSQRILEVTNEHSCR